MKKIISLMLSFLITSSLVIGCSNTKEDNSDKSETIQKSTEKVTVNMGAPDGLPAIAIAKLSQENPKIKDNYEKIILSLDENEEIYEGIKSINLINWLLK